MELQEGHCSHEAHSKGGNDTSRFGTTDSNWQCAAVEKKKKRQITIEPMSNKMLPVRPVNPSETFQFQRMLKYFIFSLIKKKKMLKENILTDALPFSLRRKNYSSHPNLE